MRGCAGWTGPPKAPCSANKSNQIQAGQYYFHGQVLDVWCDKMPCVTAPERRKLLALALASLLTTESPVVLQRVYIVFLNIVETLNDVTKTDDVGATVDSLMAGVGDVVLDTDDIDYETEHDSRKRQIAMQVQQHFQFFYNLINWLPLRILCTRLC